MTAYTVGTQPQAIFPEPLNESMTLVNTGPCTLFLDAQSSINESSYPLPPTATIVWDSRRTLWVKALSNGGQLSATLNSSASDAARIHASVLLNEQNNTVATGLITPIMEVSAYETVVILFSDPTNPPFIAPSGTTCINVIVSHLDARGFEVANDAYLVGTGGTSDDLVVVVPVLGDFMQVQLFPNVALPGGAVYQRFTLTGVTRKLDERLRWVEDMMSSVSISSVDRTKRFAAGSGYARATGDGKIWLDCVAPFATFAFAFASAVTTAGLFRLIDAATGNAIHTFDIPVTTGSQRFIFNHLAVPISRPFYLLGSSYVTAGLLDISVTWTVT